MQRITQHFSYYFTEIGFAFQLSRDARQPQWRENEAFPPLPPRKAIAVSKLTLEKMLVAYSASDPEFHACTLRQTRDREGEWWYYEISWFVYPPECNGGDRGTITVPVMFNGESPPYEMFKWEDRITAWKS